MNKQIRESEQVGAGFQKLALATPRDMVSAYGFMSGSAGSPDSPRGFEAGAL